MLFNCSTIRKIIFVCTYMIWYEYKFQQMNIDYGVCSSLFLCDNRMLKCCWSLCALTITLSWRPTVHLFNCLKKYAIYCPLFILKFTLKFHIVQCNITKEFSSHLIFVVEEFFGLCGHRLTKLNWKSIMAILSVYGQDIKF